MIDLLKKYRSKGVVMLDQIIVSGATFLINIVFAKLFGISVFGEYAMLLIVAMGLLAINQSLITAPLQSLNLSKNQDDYFGQVKGLQLLFVLSGLLVGFLAYSILISFNIVRFSIEFLPLGLFVIGFLLFDFNRKFLYIQKKYAICTLKDGITMVLQIFSIYLLSIYSNGSLSTVFYILGISYVIVEGFFFFSTQKILMPCKSLIHDYWVFGKWLMGNAVLQWFSGNYYIAVGVAVLGPYVAGVIRIAQSIIGVWNILLQALENYVPPIASKIYNESGSKSLFKYLLSIGLKGGLGLSLVGVIMLLFKEEIWEFYYGTEFVSYSYVLNWFVPLLIVNFIGFPIRFAIRTMKKTNFLFEAYVIASVVGFLSASFVVNNYGVNGICFGLIFSQFLMLSWYCLRLFKFINYENYSFSIR